MGRDGIVSFQGGFQRAYCSMFSPCTALLTVVSDATATSPRWKSDGNSSEANDHQVESRSVRGRLVVGERPLSRGNGESPDGRC